MATVNLTSDHTNTIFLNNADVLNVPTGVSVAVPAGGGDGVEGKGNNTVNVSTGGLISSATDVGVDLGTAVFGNDQVNNQGTITGATVGTLLDSYSGIILNSGTINSPAGVGVETFANNFAGIDNSGKISASITGVFEEATNTGFANESTGVITSASSLGVLLIADNGAYFNNAGKITSSSTGAFIDATGPVTVLNSGSINPGVGSLSGVEVDTVANVSFLNSGLINAGVDSTLGAGVFTEANVSFDNLVSANISGQNTGVEIEAANIVLNNAGTIEGLTSIGANLFANGNVDVDNAGVIQGGVNGLFVDSAHHTLFNSGTISASGTADQISAPGGSLTANSGTIELTNALAYFDEAGFALLDNSGTIQSLADTAVVINSFGNGILNTGLIKGFGGDGILIDDGVNNLVNSGTIVGVVTDALHIVGDDNQIVNDGPASVISGNVDGIHIEFELRPLHHHC